MLSIPLGSQTSILIICQIVSCMAKNSRNNRRKTAGKFTTNPTQYLPLCNLAKYDHIYDRSTNFIFCLKIQHISFMAYSSIFIIPELLEQILYFLAVDKSLYPTLF